MVAEKKARVERVDPILVFSSTVLELRVGGSGMIQTRNGQEPTSRRSLYTIEEEARLFLAIARDLTNYYSSPMRNSGRASSQT